MEQPCFFKLFLRFSAGPKKLKKLSMKSFDQTFEFLSKKGYFGALIFQELNFLTTMYKSYVRDELDHSKKTMEMNYVEIMNTKTGKAFSPIGCTINVIFYKEIDKCSATFISKCRLMFLSAQFLF